METYFGEIEQARSRIARERALADLQTLARDTEALVNVTAHDAREKVKEARDRVTATLDRAKSNWIELEKQSAAVARRADAVLREHPYHSVCAAFGLGILVGVLIMRSGQNERE